MTVAEYELLIRYEGPGVDETLLASTQANFLVRMPGHPAGEAAVLVNRPAMAYVAEQLGQEDTPEFRRDVARVLGRIWLARRCARLGRVEPVLVVSRATFDEEADLLDALREVTSVSP